VMNSSTRKAFEISEGDQHRFKKIRWTLTQKQLNVNVECEWIRKCHEIDANYVKDQRKLYKSHRSRTTSDDTVASMK
jgi:hypothetical protein